MQTGVFQTNGELKQKGIDIINYWYNKSLTFCYELASGLSVQAPYLFSKQI